MEQVSALAWAVAAPGTRLQLAPFKLRVQKPCAVARGSGEAHPQQMAMRLRRKALWRVLGRAVSQQTAIRPRREPRRRVFGETQTQQAEMQPRREPRRRRVPALAVALTAANGYAECWLRLRHVVRWTAALTLRRCLQSRVGSTTRTTCSREGTTYPRLRARPFSDRLAATARRVTQGSEPFLIVGMVPVLEMLLCSACHVLVAVLCACHALY